MEYFFSFLLSSFLGLGNGGVGEGEPGGRGCVEMAQLVRNLFFGGEKGICFFISLSYYLLFHSLFLTHSLFFSFALTPRVTTLQYTPAGPILLIANPHLGVLGRL